MKDESSSDSQDGQLRPDSIKDLGAYGVRGIRKKPKLAICRKWASRAKPRGKYRAVIVLVVVVLISGLGGAWLQSRLTDDLSRQERVVASQSQLISRIAKIVGPSVVSVNVSISDTSQSVVPEDFGFFSMQQSPRAVQGAGTGIIISADGLIMTNRHVVPAGTTKVSITLSDGTELKNVSVVGRTSSNDTLDVAFLKVNDKEGRKLKPAVIGDSSLMQVGDGVVAIGNALGQFQNTVTSGIISGYGRNVQAGDSSGGNRGSAAESLNNLFQTDAAINEGNSGGPLVNMSGQVIGINTAIASGSQNIGFAIPINDAKGLIDQVLENGNVARPYLGVRYIALTADVAKQYDLKVSNGAFVMPSQDPSNSSVLAESPAVTAGIKEKDVITAVNNKKVDQKHGLTSLLGQYKPGDKVKLTIVRDNKPLKIDVTLGTLPDAQ